MLLRKDCAYPRHDENFDPLEGPSGISRPYDVVDIDHDGHNEIILEEVGSHEWSLIAFRVDDKGWTPVYTGCPGGD